MTNGKDEGNLQEQHSNDARNTVCMPYRKTKERWRSVHLSCGSSSTPSLSNDHNGTCHPHWYVHLYNYLTATVAFKLKSDQADAAQQLYDNFLALQDKCVRESDKQPYIINLRGGKQISPEGMHKDMQFVFTMDFEVSGREQLRKANDRHLKIVTTISPKTLRMTHSRRLWVGLQPMQSFSTL